MFGTITMYNPERGFGFITTPTGDKFFMHISNFIKGDGSVPTLGGRVRFDVGDPIALGKKPQAKNIQYVHAMPISEEVVALVEAVKGSKVGAQ